MAVCLLKNEPYEKNLKLSGVKEEDYRAFASRFVEERGRFPYTDEIPYANSLPALEEGIKLKNSAATNDDLLKFGNMSIKDCFNKQDEEFHKIIGLSFN